MGIRSTAKAVIFRQGKLLLNKCFDEHNGSYYSLPGGGQHTDETIHEALIRECREETGYSVIPENFLALCEEICQNPKTREIHPEYIHKMYHIFLCTIESDKVQEPTEVDDMQICSEWIELDKIDNIRLMPEMLNGKMKTLVDTKIPMFLGAKRIDYNHG
jgi:ADP-ribose pyrophosphatase YjhB (NUDIX family)